MSKLLDEPAPAARSQREAELLCALASTVAERFERIELAQRVAEVCAGYFAGFCAVWLCDADETLVLVGFGQRPDAAGVAVAREAFAGAAVRVATRALFRAPVTGDTAAERSAARLLQRTGGRSMLAVPIVINARFAGVLACLESSRAHRYNLADLESAAAAGDLLGIGLENAILRERERRLADESSFLARATDLLLSTADHGEMLRLLLNVVCEQFADLAVACSSSNGAVYSVVAQSRGAGEGEATLAPGVRLFASDFEAEVIAAVRRQRPILVRKTSQTVAGLEPRLAARLAPRSLMMVPLTVGGQEYAAIVCFSKSLSYDQTRLETLQELCRRAAMALEAADTLARERRLTQTLQQATLPSHLAPIPGAMLSSVYLPAAREESVGGDWYDSYALDDHRTLVTVGDVTGHGVHASVIMGKLRHAINVIGMYETNPSRILDVAERVILRRYPDAVATAFVMIVNSSTKSALYANAGHPSPFLRYRDRRVRQLQAEGLPIGLRYISPSQPPATADLAEVELISLYTDGITESTRNVFDGERRLRSAIADDAIVLVQSAAEFIRARCLDEAAPDDVAILTVNFSQADRWAFTSSDQGSAQRSRRELAQRLQERLDPGAIAVAETIFGELLANVARYAVGDVDVALRWEGEAPILHVVDRGPGYDPAGERRAGLFEEHGRGLWLISALGGRLEVETIPGFGTHTRVLLPTGATLREARPSGSRDAPQHPL